MAWRMYIYMCQLIAFERLSIGFQIAHVAFLTKKKLSSLIKLSCNRKREKCELFEKHAKPSQNTYDKLELQYFCLCIDH